MQEFIMKSIQRANISSTLIDYYREAGSMIKFFKEKYPDYQYYIGNLIGMSKEEIENCRFSPGTFRKLLHFYIKEKAQ